VQRPRWLEICDQYGWPVVETTIARAAVYRKRQPSVSAAVHCAAIHFGHCLDYSQRANVEGRHALAISLARQCVEVLTIVDLGLSDGDGPESVLGQWINGAKSHGELRKWLEQNLWSSRGDGLWTEPWAEFFANLAKAVQPYAHYSSELMAWQPSIERVTRQGEHALLLTKVAVKNYDATRATRVTLLHAILTWALMRILAAHKVEAPISAEAVAELGRSLGGSD
jgi:hypothetical protein